MAEEKMMRLSLAGKKLNVGITNYCRETFLQRTPH